VPAGSAVASPDGLVLLDAGSFLMGSEDREVNPGDGEGPVRKVTVSPFWISRHTVTNGEFAEFVRLTGYRTGAERFGWSFVFASFLPSHLRRGAQRPEAAPWWCRVDGAFWAAPDGPGSDISDRMDHPVVHVDHLDTLAYCAWAGVRLPTEAEWEYAARGGLEGKRYAWGDELTPDGRHRCNIWQGKFPVRNTVEDGYLGTAPAESFEPNGFGLYCMAGNVWEWCSDWWTTEHSPSDVREPQGPPSGQMRVMRGGSYLCHTSYCNRYRVSARTNNDPSSCSGNIGFRIAKDA
jgi:formylglycine-generating enzyme required for sulfatase activity